MKDNSVHFAQALGSQVADKRIDILRRIGEAGSISEAARSASVSYKAAWQAIETLTNLAGVPLVEKVVGGSGGGGAQLTKTGQRLLHASELLNAARSEVLAKLGSDAEDTPMSAITSLGLRTSMRNNLPCRMKSIRKQSPSIRVELDLGDGQSLFSKITRESIDLLGLHSGQSVLALFKATAVQIAKTIDRHDESNLLHGVVSRASSTSTDAEVGLVLPSGLQLVGFAMSNHGLKKGSSAMASLDESAIVIAVTA